MSRSLAQCSGRKRRWRWVWRGLVVAPLVYGLSFLIVMRVPQAMYFGEPEHPAIPIAASSSPTLNRSIAAFYWPLIKWGEASGRLAVVRPEDYDVPLDLRVSLARAMVARWKAGHASDAAAGEERHKPTERADGNE